MTGTVVRPPYNSPATLRNLLLLLDPHRLNIRKLANSIRTQLTSITRAFHAPKRHPRVRGHHLIDENHSGLKLVDESILFRWDVAPCGCSEPKTSVIRDVNRFVDAF